MVGWNCSQGACKAIYACTLCNSRGLQADSRGFVEEPESLTCVLKTEYVHLQTWVGGQHFTWIARSRFPFSAVIQLKVSGFILSLIFILWIFFFKWGSLMILGQKIKRLFFSHFCPTGTAIRWKDVANRVDMFILITWIKTAQWN